MGEFYAPGRILSKLNRRTGISTRGPETMRPTPSKGEKWEQEPGLCGDSRVRELQVEAICTAGWEQSTV